MLIYMFGVFHVNCLQSAVSSEVKFDDIFACLHCFTGIIQSVRVLADRRLQHERRSRAAVEQELAKFRVYCQAQEREISALHSILRKHGLTLGDDGLAARAAVSPATISVVAEVNSSADMTAVEQLTPDLPAV